MTKENLIARIKENLETQLSAFNAGHYAVAHTFGEDIQTDMLDLVLYYSKNPLPKPERLTALEKAEQEMDEWDRLTELGEKKEYDPNTCEHNWEILDSGGDAESGPVTLSQCTKCHKTHTQFGM